MNEDLLFDHLGSLTPGSLAGPPAPVAVTSLSLDTRKSFPGSGAVFFCIKGPNHDGHDFIAEAYNKGWRLFVVEALPANLPRYREASFFATRSPLETLQQMAATRRAFYSIPVVGITGSNGKTIVKEWLHQLLAPVWAVVKSPKSHNSQIGVPLSVWAIDGYHEVGIFEAGISQPGEMSKLADIIRPTLGIITNLGSAHEANFTSPLQKLDEKLKLFESSRKLIFCADHTMVRERLSEPILSGVERVSWGQHTSATYQVGLAGSQLTLTGNGRRIEAELPFTDDSSVENICHAIAAALELGVDEQTLAGQLKTFKAMPMRLSLKAGIWGSTLVDDSYTNDLQGLEAALDFSEAHRQQKPLLVIVSDIVGVATENNDSYRQMARLFESKKVSEVVAIGSRVSMLASLVKIPVQVYPDTESFVAQADNRLIAGKLVLIKGARNFGFERIVETLQAKVHRTVLEINLEALQHNFHFYRSLLHPATRTMVMLKAFAYGSGGGEIGRTLQYLHADYVAVAYPDEGIDLRQQGVRLPVMVMNTPEESFDLLAGFDLEPEIFSINQLKNYAEWSSGKAAIPPIHLKVDTGMHRLGFTYEELNAVRELLKQHPNMKVASVFSHLVASEDSAGDAFTHQQAQDFVKCYEAITSVLGYLPLRHLVNTAGISRFREYHFDMVRVGIGLHGIESTPLEAGRLEPVGTLKTVVSQVRKLNAGQTVGYGRTGKITRPTEVATIAIGYADGYKMEFGKGVGKVYIRGRLVPTIGNICMDMAMVDVTGLGVEAGDEVVVFGETPTVRDLAAWAQTIPYEILTSVSERVKREYHTF